MSIVEAKLDPDYFQRQILQEEMNDVGSNELDEVSSIR